MPQRAPDEERFHVVDLDLTGFAPEGIDGVAKVFILKEPSRLEHPFAEAIALEEEGVDPEIWDRLEHRFGYVTHIHVDRSEKEGLTYGFSNELVSEGRWSQQGFYVPYPLFGEPRSSWRRSLGPGRAPKVDFPLPVWYDLNVHDDFVLPLSVDRKNVISLDNAFGTCRKISAALARVFLQTVGLETVRANLQFLRKVALIEPEMGKPLMRALTSFYRK